jgi:hypothetical protein
MQSNRSNVGSLIGGAVLIGFGLLSLIPQLFRDLNWAFLWPFIIIGAGALFFIAMFATGKGGAALAVPGSVIGGVGLVLLFQNITRRWESMSYFWTVIIMFVGLGIYLMGRYGEDEQQKKAGGRVMKVGFILFIIFGSIFEMIFSSFGNLIFPILLILLGAYLVLSRSGLFRKNDSSNDSPLPPAS